MGFGHSFLSPGHSFLSPGHWFSDHDFLVIFSSDQNQWPVTKKGAQKQDSATGHWIEWPVTDLRSLKSVTGHCLWSLKKVTKNEKLKGWLINKGQVFWRLVYYQLKAAVCWIRGPRPFWPWGWGDIDINDENL